METQKPRDRVTRILLICAAACLLGAVLLLLLKNSRGAPVFAEFSESDSLKGTRDCYLNELTVLDRYAEKEENGKKAQLMLVFYPDRDDNPVVLSLFVKEDDPIYARLSPYFSETFERDTLVTLTGYFFTEPLARQGAGAETLFHDDADAFADWYGGAVAAHETVLIFAGETEEAYEQAVRDRMRWMPVTAIALGSLVVLCAVGIPVRTWRMRRRATDRSRG